MPTHGSITKAGKVRSQTPRLDAKERTSKSPKNRNRNNHYKRFVLKRKIGQGFKRRRR